MTSMKSTPPLLTSRERLIVLVMVLVMAGPLRASSPDPHLRETSFTRLPLNDALFTEDVLMEVSARSRIDCSKKCVETEGCMMCTFRSSYGDPPGYCRLHSQLQTAADGKQSMPGAKSTACTQSSGGGHVSPCNGRLVGGRAKVNYTTAGQQCSAVILKYIPIYQYTNVVVLAARTNPSGGGYVSACNRRLVGGMAKVDYTTAQQQCRDLQGHLATANTTAEVDCLLAFANNNNLTSTYTWLGADDRQEAGVFRWADGSLLPNDSPLWGTGEPKKGSPGKDCVSIVYSHSHIWASTDGQTYHYICEKDDA
ncbi:hypothetical protein ACOMHN_001957 [Nucella lapillus]